MCFGIDRNILAFMTRANLLQIPLTLVTLNSPLRHGMCKHGPIHSFFITLLQIRPIRIILTSMAVCRFLRVALESFRPNHYSSGKLR